MGEIGVNGEKELEMGQFDGQRVRRIQEEKLASLPWLWRLGKLQFLELVSILQVAQTRMLHLTRTVILFNHGNVDQKLQSVALRSNYEQYKYN